MPQVLRALTEPDSYQVTWSEYGQPDALLTVSCTRKPELERSQVDLTFVEFLSDTPGFI